MKAYETGYRMQPRACNDPLIEAVHYYIQMLHNLQPRVYSGLAKLYLIQSGGVDMAGTETEDSPFTKPEWNLNVPQRISDRLTADGYAEYMIANGIRSYIRIMIHEISRKLQALSFDYQENDAPEWMMTSWCLKNSFNPSPVVLEKMDCVRRVAEKGLPNSIGHRDRTTAIQQLVLALNHDVDRMTKCGGRGENYPFNKEGIEAYLRFVESDILTPSTVHYRDYLLPTLQSLLDLARLLFGQLVPIVFDSSKVAIAAREANVRISNETLASIPAPTLPLVKQFEEHEVPYITNTGWMYLSCLAKVFSTP